MRPRPSVPSSQNLWTVQDSANTGFISNKVEKMEVLVVHTTSFSLLRVPSAGKISVPKGHTIGRTQLLGPAHFLVLVPQSGSVCTEGHLPTAMMNAGSCFL